VGAFTLLYRVGAFTLLYRVGAFTLLYRVSLNVSPIDFGCESR